MKKYHYTKAIHLPRIIQEGMIRTTSITGSKREKRAAWLTASDQWEICCSSGKYDPITGSSTTMQVDEMRDVFGVCRIQISNRLQTTSWKKYQYLGNISPIEFARFTEFSNRLGGNTEKWSCSFSPITKEYFDSIEMLIGDEWVEWDGIVPIEKFVDLCHKINLDTKLPVSQNIPNNVINEISFVQENIKILIEEWEKQCPNSGFLEVFVDEAYKSFRVEYKTEIFRKSLFNKTVKLEGGSYIYVNFIWAATSTMYKAALAYDPINKNLVFGEYPKAA